MKGGELLSGGGEQIKQRPHRCMPPLISKSIYLFRCCFSSLDEATCGSNVLKSNKEESIAGKDKRSGQPRQTFQMSFITFEFLSGWTLPYRGPLHRPDSYARAFLSLPRTQVALQLRGITNGHAFVKLILFVNIYRCFPRSPGPSRPQID